MDEKTRKHVQAEFTRQGRQMDRAPAFHAEPVLERFVQAVNAGRRERVLDLACGPGIVAAAIAPYVNEILGIDATPEMIRLAEERFRKAGLTNQRFAVAAAERLPFEDGWLDQVVTRLSFHHFADVPTALNEIRRVLRPNGQVVAADVISADDSERATLHNSLEQLRDPTHVRMFARAELIAMIEAAGFRVMRRETWEQPRAFEEWAAIVAEPGRTQPLERVMRALARAGQEAGISLREEAGEIRFTHSWCMVVAEFG